MSRFARVIAAGVAHHVTQRGNGRQFILSEDADRQVYLDLLRENTARHGASLIGYCLMSNHVHLILIPRQADTLAKALRHTHGRYAAYWNAKHSSSGHVWQGRYYSCPLDRPHLWEALRYTELNPVRAGMVTAPADWGWSSAAAHCGAAAAEGWLAMEEWAVDWNACGWRQYLEAGTEESQMAAVRACTHTGRPLGSDEFVRELERRTNRPLAPRKGGRPARSEDCRQDGFLFRG